MIKTYSFLQNELTEYKNPKTKIQRMVKNKELYPVGKGLYETNPNTNPFYLAGPLYSPSYISFETALSYYGIIPEAFYSIKNATFNKNKKKEYKTAFGLFIYQDIPLNAFPYGTSIVEENGYNFMIASKEKALLDLLYSLHPIQNMKQMHELIYDDYRINDIALKNLNVEMIKELGKLYHSRNIDLFIKMLVGGRLYD